MLPIPATIPRAALITAGDQPFGRAIARALGNAGFAVAIQCSPETVIDGVPGMTVLAADLADETQTEALLGRASEAIGPIGVLVNGAVSSRLDTSRAGWDMNFAINARAPYVLIQRFAEALPHSQEGVVINLLFRETRQQPVSFRLSNAALRTLTQTMALALAPRIRVNGIAHGPVGRDDGTPAPTDGSWSTEIARAALAILALPSMTGQMIVPDGVPPPPAA